MIQVFFFRHVHGQVHVQSEKEMGGRRCCGVRMHRRVRAVSVVQGGRLHNSRQVFLMLWLIYMILKCNVYAA